MSSPGTVSKILWHFTGGPKWDTDNHRQMDKPKSMKESYDILIKILKTSILKTSEYSEIVRVIIPEIYVFNRELKKREKKTNVERLIKSSPVCCLADIPIQHLDFHSYRYGNFAIGFHRESIIKGGFNPVLYSLQNSSVTNAIYAGFSQLESTDIDSLNMAANDISNSIDETQDVLDENEIDHTIDHWDQANDLERGVSEMETSIEKTKQSINDIVAFVKSFEANEFNTIYCEREWRAIKPFHFSNNDIAMVVMPKSNGFFEDLISRELLPKSVPIVPWEDLIEH